jgi:hypothetical protein
LRLIAAIIDEETEKIWLLVFWLFTSKVIDLA